VNAGKLRHQVQILAPVTNRDSYGQNVQTWTPFLTTWASIQQLRGTMLALAQARTTTAISTHLITIRANPAIRETHRVQFQATPADSIITEFDTQPSCSGSVMYTITSILDPDTRGRQMNLLCSVVKA
jgi:SPP1 family predicted phage head-tail adaptor